VPSSIRLKKDEAFEHGRNKVVGVDSQAFRVGASEKDF
jgi:hypothetical protein